MGVGQSGSFNPKVGNSTLRGLTLEKTISLHSTKKSPISIGSKLMLSRERPMQIFERYMVKQIYNNKNIFLVKKKI